MIRKAIYEYICKWYGVYMQCMAHCRNYVGGTFEGRALRSENAECMEDVLYVFGGLGGGKACIVEVCVLLL